MSHPFASASGPSARGLELYTAAVAAIGASFFLLATYTTLSASLSSQTQSKQAPPQHPSSSSCASPRPARPAPATDPTTHALAPPPSPRGKTTDQSTVQVTYPTTWDMCDAGASPEPSELASLPGSAAPASLPLRSQQKVRAGALLRWIDVVAGVAARKHAGSNCVTISVDSVLLLKPVYLGDLVHLSASVNRAWGSSLEVGVRVVKEDAKTGAKEYVSHSYLTFVAVSRPDPLHGSGAAQPPARVRLASRTPSSSATPPTPIKSKSLFGWLGFGGSTDSSPPSASSSSSSDRAGSSKVQLQPVLPQTPLEARRHIMAGRRRAKRIDDAKRGEARDGVSTEVKQRVKDEVLSMARLGVSRQTSSMVGCSEGETATPRNRLQYEAGDVKAATDGPTGDALRRTPQDIELDALELEFVVEAYVAGDPAVKVHQDKGVIEINLPGDLPLRHPLDVVERLAKQLRRQQQRGLTTEESHHAGLPRRSKANLAAPLASPTGEAATATLPSQGEGEVQAGNLVEDSFVRLAMARTTSVFSPLRRGDGGSSGVESESEVVGESDSPQTSTPGSGGDSGGSGSSYPPASAIAAPARAVRSRSLLVGGVTKGSTMARPIDVAKTVAHTLHLVFPEHANSVSVLFGGQLMDWMEEAALLTVRHVGRGRRWSTVGLDGLEFPQAVGIGEVMTFTAIVVRSFRQSCEVYVLAEAEAPNGTRRTTNDALFTLAFPLEDRQEERGAVGRPTEVALLRKVEMAAGSALETFASVAPQRRKARLEMRDMLNRLYAQPQ